MPKSNGDLLKFYLMGSYRNPSGENSESPSTLHPLPNFFFLIKRPVFVKTKRGTRRDRNTTCRVSLIQTDDKGVFFNVDERFSRTRALSDISGISKTAEILSIELDQVIKLYFCAELEAIKETGESDFNKISKDIQRKHLDNVLNDIFEKNQAHALKLKGTQLFKKIYPSKELAKKNNSTLYCPPKFTGEDLTKDQIAYNNWFENNIKTKTPIQALLIKRDKKILCFGTNSVLKKAIARLITPKNESIGENINNEFKPAKSKTSNLELNKIHAAHLDKVEKEESVVKFDDHSGLKIPELLISEITPTPHEVDNGEWVVNVSLRHKKFDELINDYSIFEHIAKKQMYSYVVNLEFSHRNLYQDVAIVNCDPMTLEGALLQAHHEVFLRKRRLLNYVFAKADSVDGNFATAMYHTLSKIGFSAQDVNKYLVKNSELLLNISILQSNVDAAFSGLKSTTKFKGLLSVFKLASGTIPDGEMKNILINGVTIISIAERFGSALDDLKNLEKIAAEIKIDDHVLKHYAGKQVFQENEYTRGQIADIDKELEEPLKQRAEVEEDIIKNERKNPVHKDKVELQIRKRAGLSAQKDALDQDINSKQSRKADLVQQIEKNSASPSVRAKSIARLKNSFFAWTKYDEAEFLKEYGESFFYKLGISQDVSKFAHKSMAYAGKAGSLVSIYQTYSTLQQWFTQADLNKKASGEVDQYIDKIEELYSKLGIKSGDDERSALDRSIIASKDRDLYLDQHHFIMRIGKGRESDHAKQLADIGVGSLFSGFAVIFPPLALKLLVAELLYSFSGIIGQTLDKFYNVLVYKREWKLKSDFDDYLKLIRLSDDVSWEQFDRLRLDDKDMEKPQTQFYYRRLVLNGFLHLVLRASTISLEGENKAYKSPEEKQSYIDRKMELLKKKLEKYNVQEYLDYYYYQVADAPRIMMTRNRNLGDDWIKHHKRANNKIGQSYLHDVLAKEPEYKHGKYNMALAYRAWVPKNSAFTNIGVHTLDTGIDALEMIVQDLEIFQVPLQSNEVVKLTKLYVLDRAVLETVGNNEEAIRDKKNWLVMHEFTAKYGCLSPFDPVRMIICLNEMTKIGEEDYTISGLYRYNIQLLSGSSKIDFEGPVYKGMLEILRDEDIIDVEQDKELVGKLGCVVYPSYTVGDSMIYGLRPFSDIHFWEESKDIYGEHTNYIATYTIKSSAESVVQGHIHADSHKVYDNYLYDYYFSYDYREPRKIEKDKDRYKKLMSAMMNKGFLTQPIIQKRHSLSLFEDCTSRIFVKTGDFNKKHGILRGDYMKYDHMSLDYTLWHHGGYNPSYKVQIEDYLEPWEAYFLFVGKANHDDFKKAGLRSDSFPLSFDYSVNQEESYDMILSIPMKTIVFKVGIFKDGKIIPDKDKASPEVEFINKILESINGTIRGFNDGDDVYLGTLRLEFENLEQEKFHYPRPILPSYDTADKIKFFQLWFRNITSHDNRISKTKDVHICSVKYRSLTPWLNDTVNVIEGKKLSSGIFKNEDEFVNDFISGLENDYFIDNNRRYQELAKELKNQKKAKVLADKWLRGNI